MERVGSNKAAQAAIAAAANKGARELSSPMVEQLASHGHVLFERVSVLWRKARKIGWLMAASVSIGLLSYVLPNYFGGAVAKVATTVSGWFSSKAELPVASPAPAVGFITPRNPYQLSDVSGLLTAPEFVAAMKDATAKLQAGQAIDCERGLKVTDEWVTDANPVPRCRESADKTRVWVWGAVKTGNGFAPTFGVMRKTADGKATFARVDVPGTIQLQGVDSVNPQLVPRAIAADFAELNLNGGRQ